MSSNDLDLNDLVDDNKKSNYFYSAVMTIFYWSLKT